MDGATIAEAVLAVGFPGLTFAAVSEQLGVAQATLYRHAANRDELVRLGIDLALRRTPWPGTEGPWHTLLERWSIAAWHAWERHPGAVVEATRGIVPASMMGLADTVGVALMQRGFTAGNAALAVDLVFDLASDSRRMIETLDLQPGPPDRPGMRDLMAEQWLSAPAAEGASEALHDLRAEMVRAMRVEPIEWFQAKLRIVLSGIARELAPRSQPPEKAR